MGVAELEVSITRTLEAYGTLGFVPLAALVMNDEPNTSRTAIRRVLNMLIRSGVVGEDTAPGLAAYYLAKPAKRPR